MRLGAHLTDPATGRCEFTVWAPLVENVSVDILQIPGGGPEKAATDATAGDGKACQGNREPIQRLPMAQDDWGYWQAIAQNIPAGTHYRYHLESANSPAAAWPDPASHYQPAGVHGPSAVVDHSDYDWQDGQWEGVALADYIIYELHIGTFTPEGTFEAAIARLPDLVDLGITVIEVMPVAQCPGDRNWGYDGVYPFAVQSNYGGPTGLKQFVDACHQHGLAVMLDVVYNHFGPEGNYTGKFGPYTTDHYHSLWGDAINFDNAYAPGVRHYFIENALHWLRDYHIDALRLDAVQAIYDFGAKHFLLSLSEAVKTFANAHNRRAYLIAESDLNDPRLLHTQAQGGFELNAQWSDDFHHALHAQLTGESIDYYSDFTRLEDLAAALQNRFVYAGQYSQFRHRDHGRPATDLSSERFVVCSQNHDQVGNRIAGDRLSCLLSFEGQKLAAGAVILSPYLPLLFMGEEYGETAPFFYFVDHSDQALLESIRVGRQEEFKAMHKEGTPMDAACPETFNRCILSWPEALLSRKVDTFGNAIAPKDAPRNPQPRNSQMVLRSYYQRLIQVRKACKINRPAQHSELTAWVKGDLLYYYRSYQEGDLLCIMNFGQQPHPIELSPGHRPPGHQTWTQKLYSADPEWMVETEAASDPQPSPLPPLAKQLRFPQDNVEVNTTEVNTTEVNATEVNATAQGHAIAPLSIALYQANV
jgi:maltooligosyltrehalose trehalohydrolase